MTVIFAGPTISKQQIHEILPDAIVLPPAAQGDIDFAHFGMGADTILLIDGVHRQQLPPWHKEILGVLQDGCRFVGASSMGALRAVECEPWGAEPIGEIAGWYSAETIDADDEVCLKHGDKSTHYQKLSVPLVNIRASLISANLPSDRQAEYIEAAQSMFYADRNWKPLFEKLNAPDSERSVIRQNELDLKAIDAITALHYIEAGPNGSNGRRWIFNYNKGYGGVFLANDRKSWNGQHVVREHNIAHTARGMAYNAANRALALEFCKVAGILKQHLVDDQNRIKEEEDALLQAREWLMNAASGFKTIPTVNDFLKAVDQYEHIKRQTL